MTISCHLQNLRSLNVIVYLEQWCGLAQMAVHHSLGVFEIDSRISFKAGRIQIYVSFQYTVVRNTGLLIDMMQGMPPNFFPWVLAVCIAQ